MFTPRTTLFSRFVDPARGQASHYFSAGLPVPVRENAAGGQGVGYRALTDALRQLAPAEQHGPNNPLHNYALRAEPDHLRAGGRHRRHDQLPCTATLPRQWMKWNAGNA